MNDQPPADDEKPLVILIDGVPAREVAKTAYLRGWTAYSTLQPTAPHPFPEINGGRVWQGDQAFPESESKPGRIREIPDPDADRSTWTQLRPLAGFFKSAAT